MRTALLLLASAAVLQAQTFTVLYAPVTWDPGSLGGEGLYLVDSETGNVTTLYSGVVRNAAFSPDGKKVAFQRWGQLRIIDNDGYKGEDVVVDESINIRGDLVYTTNGIFWMGDVGETEVIYRYVVGTDRVEEVLTIPLWPNTERHTYYASRDGRKGFAWIGAAESWGTATDNQRPYITFSNDFSTADYHLKRLWGHGNVVLSHGNTILMVSWDEIPYDHQSIFVVKHADGEILDTVYNQLPQGQEIDAIRGCVNNDEYVAFTSGDQCYAWHWRDASEPVPIPGGDLGYLHGVWMGALPTVGASLSLAVSQVALTSEDSTATVGVSVSDGVGTPTTAVPAAHGAWLSASVSADGGSGYTLAVVARPSAVATPRDSGIVVVNAPGVAESETLSVSYAATSYNLTAPTGLAADLSGDSALDVTLTWTNTSSGAEGTAIERKSEGGHWEQVATVGPTETTWTDVRPPKATYSYRVHTYRGSDHSANSNAVTIAVTGVPWIRFTISQQSVCPGDTVLITWEANLVYNIQVDVSLDYGENWSELNTDGSITPTDSLWSALPWVVPITETDSIQLRIHPYQDYSIVTTLSVAVVNTETHSSASAPAGGGITARYSPERGLLELSGHAHAPCNVAVYALDGRCVARLRLPAGVRTVRVPLVSAGSYLVMKEGGGYWSKLSP
ncbi:MAG: hypothetical protein GF331_03235 [Chitinivibrionales bacterium]|nr:hypothetical protein [Chitinivibrionales bacterium]